MQNDDDEEEDENEDETGDYSILSTLETTMTVDYSILHKEEMALSTTANNNDRQEEEEGDGLVLHHDVNETTNITGMSSTATPSSTFQKKRTKRLHVDITLTDEISHNDGKYSDVDKMTTARRSRW